LAPVSHFALSSPVMTLKQGLEDAQFPSAKLEKGRNIID
jgi:hypothetical protein